MLPPPILAPLFFADPAGAVVGKWATRNLPCNPRVYQQKTLCGSLAVLLLTPAALASIEAWVNEQLRFLMEIEEKGSAAVRRCNTPLALGLSAFRPQARGSKEINHSSLQST